MATVVLKNAGNSFVDSFGFDKIPIVGNYVTGRINQGIGSAANALGGSIDSKIFGYEDRNVIRGKKLSDFAIQSSSYGDSIQVIYGKSRIAGNIIWATPVRIVEDRQVINQGGKGGGTKVERKSETRFRYFVNLAIALCEGEIDSIDRIWADADLINVGDFCTSYSIYKGEETQLADPLIESFEGVDKTPAYRGLAYIVFEDFEITQFGARIPNFTFEVNRNLNFSNENIAEKLISGVNMIPGCGEFVYDTVIHSKVDGVDIGGKWYQKGQAKILNKNNSYGKSDALVALDNLQNTFPNLDYISLVCCWFGDSLDIVDCTIEPRVEYKTLTKTFPTEWSVAGINRDTARLITLDVDGKPIYGGTPSDASILRFIDEAKNRGLKVKFYPMIFMDIANKPWRGKITGDAAEVANFFTKTKGYNEFILHYANLVKNKVDAFIIGSEMKGLTSIQSGSSFPAVEEFISLAAEVKTIMGSSTKISYASDWSEYHSVNGWYNLDALWASDDIDFIGIDAYFPLTDRPQNGVYDVQEIIDGWTNGEGYDWYYSDEDRTVKVNLQPQYAWKNIAWWWNNTHTNPDSSITDWEPQSKKIWFTEYGFPSVDGASNQPNIFFNPESVDGGLPYHSQGYIDFLAQRTALEGTELKWQSSNMIERKFVWAFDARPYPFYPDLTNVWADGDVWSRGHWVNGKLGYCNLSDIVKDICLKSGLSEDKIDISEIKKLVAGYNLSSSARGIDAISDLQEVYFFDMVDGEKIKFIPKEGEITEINFDKLTFENSPAKTDFILSLEKNLQKNLISEITLNYISQNNNYQVGSYNIKREEIDNGRKTEVNSPILLNNSTAQNIAKNLLLQEETLSQRAEFFLPYEYSYLEAGDIIKITTENNEYLFRIILTDCEDGKIRISAVNYEANIYNYNIADLENSETEIVEEIADTHLEILDIPSLQNDVDITKPILRMAVCGTSGNWDGAAIYMSNISDVSGFQKIIDVTNGATIGTLLGSVDPSSPLIMDKTSEVEINLISGSLESVTDSNLQDFKNLALIGDEILQFKTANILGENNYELKNLYRGRFGTEGNLEHSAGERFIMLDDNIVKLEIPLQYLGNQLWIKAVSFGKSLEDTEAVEITFAANSLKPYSPVYISGTKNISNDIEIDWVRRSRAGNSFSSTVEIPLYENAEKYEIDIYDGADVVRTLEATNSEITYEYANQITDFGTSPTSLNVKIYQVSDKVGRGFDGAAALEV